MHGCCREWSMLASWRNSEKFLMASMARRCLSIVSRQRKQCTAVSHVTPQDPGRPPLKSSPAGSDQSPSRPASCFSWGPARGFFWEAQRQQVNTRQFLTALRQLRPGRWTEEDRGVSPASCCPSLALRGQSSTSFLTMTAGAHTGWLKHTNPLLPSPHPRCTRCPRWLVQLYKSVFKFFKIHISRDVETRGSKSVSIQGHLLNDV